MRPAALILLEEAVALRAVLASVPEPAFDRPTVCTGWSVRDVLAHCGAALSASAAGTQHSYSAAANQRDVDLRKHWSLTEVLSELYEGYGAAAGAIDRAGGALDGVGLGEWIHGGDVREALGASNPYTSAGVELAIPLLVERSRARSISRVEAHVDGRMLFLGTGESVGLLTTDTETFVRLCGGRRPASNRFEVEGITQADLVLFS